MSQWGYNWIMQFCIYNILLFSKEHFWKMCPNAAHTFSFWCTTNVTGPFFQQKAQIKSQYKVKSSRTKQVISTGLWKLGQEVNCDASWCLLGSIESEQQWTPYSVYKIEKKNLLVTKWLAAGTVLKNGFWNKIKQFWILTHMGVLRYRKGVRVGTQRVFLNYSYKEA